MPEEWTVLLPALMLLAFSLENFLKSLLVFRGWKPANSDGSFSAPRTVVENRSEDTTSSRSQTSRTCRSIRLVGRTCGDSRW